MGVNRKIVFSLGIAVFCGTLIGAQTPVRPATTQNTAGQATPQRGIISGSVTKAGTGEAVKKATVTLMPANQGNRGQNGGPGQFGQPGQIGQPGQPAGRGQPPQAGQQTPAPAPGQAPNAQNNQQGQRGQGGGGARSLMTDDNGAFTFQDVQPGTYRIRVDRDAYLTQEYGQRSWTGAGTPVTVQPGQKLSNISFQLIQGGTIAGRILDENLEPVTGIQVQALAYSYQGGSRTLVSERQVQTNDLGEYRLYWLTPGDHFVSAIPNSRRGGLVQNAQQRGGPPEALSPDEQEETYAATFYPGGIDPERASPVQVAASSEVRGIDFVLRPIRTVRIRGTVLAAPALPAQQPQQQQQQQGRGRGGDGGRGNRGGRVEVVLTRIGASATGGRGGGGGGRGGGGRGFGGTDIQRAANVSQDGTFEIANVIPGSYNLTAVQQQQNQIYSTRMRLEVGQTNVEGLNLAVRPGMEIQGQFYAEGTPPQNFQMDRVRVSLTPVENLPLGNANAQVDATGKFVLTNVQAMTYRVNVQGLPSGSYLIAGRYGSADPLVDMLQVDQASPLSLQIGFNPGQITGIVTDSTGQPFAGAITVLIPAVRTRMDMYRNVTSDQSGRFSFAGVAPGDYKLLAWEDVPQGAYLNADYVAPFEDRAQSLNVARDAAATLEVKVIPRENR